MSHHQYPMFYMIVNFQYHNVDSIRRTQPLEYTIACLYLSICPQTHAERPPEDEWLDILPHPVFSPDGDSFLLLASIQETGTEHFTHIKHVTITQQRISVISHGRYEVCATHWMVVGGCVLISMCNLITAHRKLV